MLTIHLLHHLPHNTNTARLPHRRPLPSPPQPHRRPGDLRRHRHRHTIPTPTIHSISNTTMLLRLPLNTTPTSPLLQPPLLPPHRDMTMGATLRPHLPLNNSHNNRVDMRVITNLIITNTTIPLHLPHHRLLLQARPLVTVTIACTPRTTQVILRRRNHHPLRPQPLSQRMAASTVRKALVGMRDTRGATPQPPRCSHSISTAAQRPRSRPHKPKLRATTARTRAGRPRQLRRTAATRTTS